MMQRILFISSFKSHMYENNSLRCIERRCAIEKKGAIVFLFL